MSNHTSSSRKIHHRIPDKDEIARQNERYKNDQVYNADSVNIKNYTDLFRSHKLLSAFPFSSFPRKEQLCFIKRVKYSGTGALLSAVSNETNPQEGITNPAKLQVEWNEENIDLLLNSILSREPSETMATQLIELQKNYHIAHAAFHHTLESKLYPLQMDVVEEHLHKQFLAFKSLPDSLQTDGLVLYIRFVENCIRTMLIFWSAAIYGHLSGLLVTEDFPYLTRLMCRLQLHSNPLPSSETIASLPITDAFHHYCIYLKYIEPFIAEGNVEKQIYNFLASELSTWDKSKLCLFPSIDQALEAGLQAANIQIKRGYKEKVRTLYEFLNSQKIYFNDPFDSCTWALLGLICFKCDTKTLPITITRKSKDTRTNRTSHDKGSIPSSLKKFANQLSGLKPGELLLNDMRLFYIEEIFTTGFALLRGTYNEIADMRNYMDRITDTLSILFLLYDSSKAATIADELLLGAWRSFTLP